MARDLAEIDHRGILDALPEGVIALDRRGMIVYANAQITGLLDRPLHGLVNRPLSTFITVDLRTEYAEEFQRVVRSAGESRRLLTSFQLPYTGTRSVSLALSHPAAEGSDLVLAFVTEVGAVPLTVSADPQGEVVKGSEDAFRSLMIGVLIFGRNGTLVASNPAALDLLGRSKRELSGLPTLPGDTVFREDGSPLPRDERPVPLAFANLKPVRNMVIGIERPRRRDRKWLLTNADPMFDDRGALSRVVCTFSDITELKSAEEALRTSEARMRALFDFAPVGIELSDRDGCVVATNRALQEMLGYSAGELTGRHWTETRHPDDIAQEAGLGEELAAGLRDHYEVETRSMHRDGRVLWTRSHVSVVRDEGGNPQFSIQMVEDVTERKSIEQQVRHQALHDALTELPNRILLNDRLEQSLVSAHRGGDHVSLLLMDLNNFKDVNDTFGHGLGDALLREVSSRLRATVREQDTVARLGGDEFAMVLPGTDLPGAVQTADKLVSQFDTPFLVEGQSLDMSTSVGIAMFPVHGTDADTLLRHADVAMYTAKRDGLGRAVYEAANDQYSPERLGLVGELRRAISGNSLRLYFQPKATPSGEVSGVEALVRWEHPERGLVAPGDFVPLAERTGLIRPLTLWVVNRALEQVHVWQRQGIHTRIGINLSAQSLHDVELFAQVEQLIRTWNVTPSALGMEITESAVMADPERAKTTLDHLAGLGVNLSIDDFGTGYSSLSYLQRLPVREIKIDRSFVTDMMTNENDSHIVQATIDLGHALGLGVVAEGVEDQETHDRLATLGCDVIQGFFLASPMPSFECTEWLLLH